MHKCIIIKIRECQIKWHIVYSFFPVCIKWRNLNKHWKLGKVRVFLRYRELIKKWRALISQAQESWMVLVEM